MLRHIIRFIFDEEGLSVVEYVISAALLSVVLVTVFSAWGNALLQELMNLF
ncbi:Flp family type IVb pilin [Vibrio mangrovi]|uniref:Flp family type IVb pilin n=1 Tax=Vibrio mangrovi TaxID=474394 RepID=A0A1Y6J358_9VIBR|nr:Flp family type IVb pilin [Vibrio mangrovi]MDW6002358.1 Flp family type IVb pilin [Vibrio mangrovi]SMS02743.1 hypothetical protein VIM7927_04083 [Vibrio mangrovi]